MWPHKGTCHADSGNYSTCTADGYDSMDSTGDSSKKMRGGVKSEAGQLKKEGSAIPLQKPKKTRGRVKIEYELIENTLRRRKTFSKRKHGIINKVKQLSTLTGSQALLLVASETGHLYTFATDKLQPIFTSEVGKALIQSCLKSPLNSPPPPHDEPTDVSATAAVCYKEEMDLTFHASESESLGNTNDESKPYFNNVPSLPGTTTTCSSSNAQFMLPTTSPMESSRLQVQQSQALISSLPMEGPMMYPSPPYKVITYNMSQGPCDLRVSHEELMEFALNMQRQCQSAPSASTTAVVESQAQCLVQQPLW